MKCERFMDAPAVTFEVLSDDYQKLVFLRQDRQVEFHVKYGKYYSTRIPKFGRDMAYSPMTCDLYCACSGSDVYRLHLEQGRFLRPFETECPAVNKCELSLQHQLLGCAGTDGRIECWDQRQRTLAGALDVGAALRGAGGGTASVECTALQFADNGLNVGVGTSSGHCLLFDLRSTKPLQVMDHKYGLPIVSLNFAADGYVVSADSKLVKVWGSDDGQVLTNIEPPADINDVCVWPGSGLLFMAAETQKIQTFYVPALGLAPKWCRFLDNLTEELEEEGPFRPARSPPHCQADARFSRGHRNRRSLRRLQICHARGACFAGVETSGWHKVRHFEIFPGHFFLEALACADPSGMLRCRAACSARTCMATSWICGCTKRRKPWLSRLPMRPTDKSRSTKRLTTRCVVPGVCFAFGCL